MLPKPERLTTKDISVLSQGKSVFGTLISLRYIAAPKLKFAVTVSKKIAPKAVDRNRIRRRIYAVVRNFRAGITKPSYIMLSPKKECLTVPREAIEKDIFALFNKALK